MVPLVWVTLTGWLLNHTVDWRLDQRQLDHPWLLQAYGMTPSGEAKGGQFDKHHVIEWDGQIFLGTTPLQATGKLLGAVPDGSGVAVVTDLAVLRIESSGQVLETLDQLALPALPLSGCAFRDGRVLLANEAGWHEAAPDWLTFRPRPDLDITAQHLVPVKDPSILNPLRRSWAQGGLPASRVILDLHAGRFLGPFAKYFYDFVSLCTVIICVTGAVLFFRPSRRQR